MVKFAGHVDLMSWIPTDVKQVGAWDDTAKMGKTIIL